MIRRCVIFRILGIHLFPHFNQVKKNQLLLNEVVNITDAKKKTIGLLKLVGYEKRKNIYFLCDLIMHDFGIFFKLMAFFFLS